MSASPKLTRGRILAILKHNAPKPVTVELLFIALDELEFDTPKERIEQHLKYLEEQSYLRVERGWNELVGAEYCRAIISQKGLALVNGDIDEDDWVDPRGYEG